jgi:hypothetical protein
LSVTERIPEGSTSVGYEGDEGLEGQRVAALAKLYEAGGPIDLDGIDGPMYWPLLRPGEAHQEWEALRAWVEQLVVRFAHLDHHVIPRCWFRHNGHVEALVALRDQERVNYSDTAPGSAAVDWHRAFRDIEVRLREWTGQLACGAAHEVRTHQVRSVDSEVWRQFVNDDVTRRQDETVNGPLAD